jgi:hypothetical protein
MLRIHKGQPIRLLAALLIFYSQFAEATTFYVRPGGLGASSPDNGGVDCTNYQTDNDAHASGSIVSAIACLAGAGDTVTIRAGTFTETSPAIVPASGAAGNPIIIQGTGATTVWKVINCGADTIGCALQISAKSYIRLTNVSMQDVRGRTQIDVLTNAGAATGIEILNSSFINNGNRGVLDGATDMSRIIYMRGSGGVISPKINNNTFIGNYGANIWCNPCINGQFNDNVATYTLSSQFGPSNGNLFSARFLMQLGGGSNNNEVKRNRMGLSERDSYASSSWSPSAIKLDAGSSGNLFEDNVVYDVNVADAGASYHAFEAESGCNNNIFRHNVLTRSIGEGFTLGSKGTNQNTGNILDGNSMRDVTCGIVVVNADSAVIKNNIVHQGTTNPQSAFFKKQGSNCSSTGNKPCVTNDQWKNNLVYDTNGGNTNYLSVSGSAIGSCQTPNTTYATWVSTVGETNSIGPNQDPKFVSATDLHLQAGSPAIDHGEGGIDMGAFQAVGAPTGSISLLSPNGGELYLVDQTITVGWTSLNLSGNINIELSRNNGGNLETLVSNTANDGTQAIAAPIPTSSNCLVCVSSVNDPSIRDCSDLQFRIGGTLLPILKN